MKHGCWKPPENIGPPKKLTVSMPFQTGCPLKTNGISRPVIWFHMQLKRDGARMNRTFHLPAVIPIFCSPASAPADPVRTARWHLLRSKPAVFALPTWRRYCVITGYPETDAWRPDKGLIQSTICNHAGYGPVRISQTTGSLISHLTTRKGDPFCYRYGSALHQHV